MRLEEICTVFTDGDWIESKDQSDDGIRLIQTGNIGEGIYLEKEARAKYISEEIFGKLKCTEIFPGDILVSRLPDPVGRACIIPEKEERMITAVDCTICRPNESIISKEYLCYFMRSSAYYKKLLGSVTGTTRKRISRKNLGNVELEVPSKERQMDVVEQLDCLVKVIESRKQELQLLDTLIKARFVEMFGSIHDGRFDMKTLLEIVNDDKNSIKRGPFGGALKKEDFVEDGYLVYEQRHAIHNDFEYAKYYITQEKYEGMIGFKVVPGDLIISCSGVTLGRIAEVPEGAKEGIINQALLKLSLNPHIMMNTFFIQQFRGEEIQNILFGFSRGSGIPNMPSMSEVKAVKFICPPLELQKEYCDFVHQVDKSK
ncbi:restriction endonuclease subunit S, partial [Clostridium sp. AF15-31]